jgi:glycosyltransferase involved in cell wall biosynthesis
MKICHVTSLHDWRDDRIFERACKGLFSLGHDVHLVASTVMNHYHSDNGRLADEKVSVIEGVNIHWIKPRKNLSRRLVGSFEATLKAMQLAPDIIHFHDPDLIPFMIIAKCRGNKVIYDVHENYASRLIRPTIPKFIQKPLSFFYRRLENAILRFFNGSVFVTNSLLNLCNADKSKAIVIGNLPYLNLLSSIDLPENKHERITVVTSGIISFQRNVEETVLSAVELYKRNIPVDFIFAGKYAPGVLERLTDIVHKHKITNVRFEPMVHYLENFKRVARTHIGCVFYEDNPNNRIGLPNRAFEYMYCGLALMGDDFPEVRKLIEDADCGIIVDSKNPKKLADDIADLINNPSVIQKFGFNGRKAVYDKYNYEQSLLELDSFYQKITISK